MVKFFEFAELNAPEDLLKKLRRDLISPEQATHNQHDVFDNFDTTDNMIVRVSSRDKDFRGRHFKDNHPLQPQPQKTSSDGLVKTYCRGQSNNYPSSVELLQTF
jgi:hypothetical protein